MSAGLHVAESSSVNDALLDSQVTRKDQTINGALQSQWKLICNGMTARAGVKLAQVNDSHLMTGLEIAGSFSLSVGFEQKPKLKESASTDSSAAKADAELNSSNDSRECSSPKVRTEQFPVAAEPKATEVDVKNAFVEARQAVNDFAATKARHTTALKKVNDYIGKASNCFSADQPGCAKVPELAGNVDQMLVKLENWDRAPAWIRPADRAQIMQRNNFDTASMDKFEQWYQTQNKAFVDNPNMSPEERLLGIQQHLSRRVNVESVKNWLRTAPEVEAVVSPIIKDGFRLMAAGKLPDGRDIPKGSDMIVFEKRKLPDADEQVVLPFAKDWKHVQRFDDTKIAEGLRKLAAMASGGPQSLSAEDLYAFRLDHDPGRLSAATGQQVGYAVLRPGGPYAKNVMYMKFSDSLDPKLIPEGLRADCPDDGRLGTNTGALYNMVKNARAKGAS